MTLTLYLPGVIVSWLLLVFLTFTNAALAAPAGEGNVTLRTYGDTIFASEPHGRGTVGIIITCTATFIFCIWTAVHPNVVPGCIGSQRLYYKSVLMLVSIMVPEGLLICAIGEYRTARRLKNAWRSHDWSETGGEEARLKVDMKVAFFVGMGGFFVDQIDEPVHEEWATRTRGDPSKFWTWKNNLKGRLGMRKEAGPPPRPYRAILTPTGFINYMKHGLIHEDSFDKAAITDKGKASTFGKFLAALQALWLVASSFNRWRSGLPLSLLEIHVLIHVVRTALLYGFWWRKPLDVNEPIRIILQRKVREVASEKARYVSIVSEISSISGYEDIQPETPQVGPKESAPIVFRPLHEYNKEFEQDDGENGTLEVGTESRLKYHAEKSREYRPNEPNFITIQSPRTFIAFHNKAMYDIVIQVDVGERKDRIINQTGIFLQVPNRVGTDLSENWRKHFLRERTLILLGEALLVCLTGALHAAAWRKEFPSDTEKWLWRMASLAMCYCCLGIFLIANFTEYEQDLIAGLWKFHLRPDGFRKTLKYIWEELDNVCLLHSNDGVPVSEEYRSQKRKTKSYILHQAAIWMVLLFVGFYFFSVLFITVESYLSLREVPPEMFLTPSWTDYWPHL